MIVFGAHILALTEDGHRLLAWSTETGGETNMFVHGCISLMQNQPSSQISSL
jgi:hypothetical protein